MGDDVADYNQYYHPKRSGNKKKKGLENISDEVQELIKDHLKVGKNKGLKLLTLKGILEDEGFGNISAKVLYDNLKFLKEKGIVSVYSEGIKNEYFLTHLYGSHEQRKLQNQGWYRNLSRYFTKGLGAILILFGIGIFIYRTISPSGAVISVAN